MGVVTRTSSGLQSIADCEDARAVFFQLLLTDAGDGAELVQGAGMLEYDAAQRGGAEDKELWQAKTFGFGLAPVAQTGFELLLVWRQWGRFSFAGGAFDDLGA